MGQWYECEYAFELDKTNKWLHIGFIMKSHGEV